jgi:hypothetical protein
VGMITMTKTLELRTFDELTESEKETLIEKVRYREVEDTDWAEWIEEEFVHELESNGWTVDKKNIPWYANRAKIAFNGDLDICEFAEKNIKNFIRIDDTDENDVFREIKSMEGDVNCRCEVNRCYDAELDISEEIEFNSMDLPDGFDEDDIKKANEQWQMIKEAIEKHHEETIKKFGKMLEEQYDYLQSDEYWAEYFRDQGMYFDEDLEEHYENEFTEARK